jgi:transcriptional regulator with XRE-family HTH domain
MEEDLNYQVKLIERVKKELGLNQAELSKKIGVSPSKLSEWNSKKRKTPKVVIFALKLMLKNKELEKDSDLLNLLSERITRR